MSSGVVIAVSLVCVAAGYVLSAFAMRYRNPEDPPRLILLPSQWVPVWKMKRHFTGPGFTLYMYGTFLIVAGLLFSFVVEVLLR